LFKKIYVLIFLLLIIVCVGTVHSEDIMNIDEIKPGMKGIAKTVFKGEMVEEFPVEIINIIKDKGLQRHLILIRAGGEKIDKIGGIAAGMSGSPVYINNKLIGAIGYGWANADSHYVLVTPIEEMLELFSKVPGTIEYTNELPVLQTPLMVSGLSGRAFTCLKEDLQSLNFKVLPGNGLKDYNKNDTLEPGSAVAVQLARGDINVASIGTVTYVEDNQLLAFGHSFTNKGEVDYLLSKAYINAIIPSKQMPFKLGAPYNNLIGSIKNDRGTGIAGKLNCYPEIIPLNIRVYDKERDIEKHIMVQIVNDELFFTSLGSNIVLQAIDETLDRIGDGTAEVKIKVMGNGLPDLEIERNNMYYSKSDIAGMSLADFYQILNIIFTNSFKEINVIEIVVDVQISSEDRVALVQEAEVLNEEIYPGDKVNIKVTLHPYRQESFTKLISLQLPSDIEPGRTSIIIEGGTIQSYSQVLTEEHQQGDYEINQAQIEGYKNFSEMINDFINKPQNNDLIAQIYRGYTQPVMESVNDEKENNENTDQDEDKEPEIKTIEKTKYVLEGSLNLDINIKQPENTENKSNNNNDNNNKKCEDIIEKIKDEDKLK